jgi:hypothetical protein
MYSTCVWCYANLGQNETIEHFPVGRRLAFDGATGRLWVVCRKCERWNLTPLDERWEAIEECERRFRATRLRASTDEIGLARVGDGLDLIRIGTPLRPEFAAWRYGDVFRRRRRRSIMFGGAAVGLMALAALGPLVGITAGAALCAFPFARQAVEIFEDRRARTWLRIPGQDKPVVVRRAQLDEVSLARVDDDWELYMPYTFAQTTIQGRRQPAPQTDSDYAADLSGRDAFQAAGKLLAAINSKGASATTVRSAVELLEETPNAQEMFVRFAQPRTRSLLEDWSERVTSLGGGYRLERLREPDDPPVGFEAGALLRDFPHEVRLALEMAAHEDSERRAMEGELTLLALAWREAAEIAALADNLLVPNSIEKRIDEIKGNWRG